MIMMIQDQQSFPFFLSEHFFLLPKIVVASMGDTYSSNVGKGQEIPKQETVFWCPTIPKRRTKPLGFVMEK